MSKLLSQNDKAICENIVKISDSLDAKRAKALLLIDEGITHVKAADDSELSIGQVKYILAKYRTIGLATFPTELTVSKEENKAVERNEATSIKNDTQIISKKEIVEKEKLKTKKKKVKKKSKKKKSKKNSKLSKKKDKKSKKKKKK